MYQQSPWVYVAINRIAEAAALVPLRVLQLDGERRVEVERHPLEALLDAPNPYLSRFELFEQTFRMLELTGNAYWFWAGTRPARRSNGRCAGSRQHRARPGAVRARLRPTRSTGSASPEPGR
jgi:phage portal protein BeeE